jgi:hypothetical protein
MYYSEESATTMWKKTTSLFTKKKGSSSSKPSTPLRGGTRFRISSEYEGGHGTSEEEHSSRWREGHTKLVYKVHRTSRTYGGAARLTSSLDTIIHSTSICSAIFRWVYHHDGGGGEEARSP